MTKIGTFLLNHHRIGPTLDLFSRQGESVSLDVDVNELAVSAPD